MKTSIPKSGKRLLIQTGGLFNSAAEWCIVDFVYWRSLDNNRRFTCRTKHIQQFTPVKRIETITAVMDRLCERGMGFSKSPYGKPQRRRCGDGLTAEPVQSYQYMFDANAFDAWLKSQPPIPPIRKRIDPYPKADSQLSENGQQSYPKADTTIRDKKEEKKEIKEMVGSQPPSTTAAAPVPSRNYADEFERFFTDGSPPTSKSAAALQPERTPAEEFDMLMRELESKAAEDGGAAGVVSSPIAAPVPTIQFACGNSNGGENGKPDDGLGCAGAAVIQDRCE